ncbi:MAG: ParA family protein [Planctomycetaceae bacterium]|nr:ParA family protein [Planctomycetaceae bacterium]MBV8384711.1 ParA family protein [Planctomycetaceae bacterium]
MRSIAWLSEKGGTAKTTSAINSAVGLAKLGHRVLLVDADPQANATMVLLEGRPAEAPTLAHVLIDQTDAAGAIRPTRTAGLDVLPSDTLLADANVALASELGRERRLKLALEGRDAGYDFVVIDTSPQRTLINVNVLNYVGEVLCPVDPGIFALSGLGTLRAAVAEVARYLDNRALRLGGLVLTRTQRDNITRDVAAQLRGTFGELVFRTTIPGTTKIGEAHARFLSVLDYAPRSSGAKAYKALVAEIIGHGQVIGIGEGAAGTAEADHAGDPGDAGRGPRRRARAG